VAGVLLRCYQCQDMSIDTTRTKIVQASNPQLIEAVRELFLEYQKSLGFSLCFQGFDSELAGLPGAYAEPSGSLLVALQENGQAIGCVALRRVNDTLCEMKRLYVRPSARGVGLGKRLLDAILFEGQRKGYREIRLDTISGQMDSAIELYRRNGFVEVDPWYAPPLPSMLFLSRAL
jgi:ribosomal protein S18 acetylase RimI-like enzyme